MKTSPFRLQALLTAFFLSGAALLAQGQGPGHGPGEPPEDFPGFAGHHLEHNLVLAQVAVGPNATTTIVLHNLGNPQRLAWASADELEVSGTIFFFNPDGTPLEVTPAQGDPSSEVPFLLGPSQIAFLDFSAAGPDRSGWALIELGDDDSEGDPWGLMDGHSPQRGERLMATAFYTIQGQGGAQSQVGVIPAVFERGLHLTSVLAAQAGGNLDTGVAVVNIDSQAADIQLRLRSADGQMVASTMINLPAGNQVARFLKELFGQQLPEPFQGTLEVVSDEDGVVTLGLLSNQGLLTSIPTRHFGQWVRGSMMP